MDHIYRANVAAMVKLIETALTTPEHKIECHQIDDAIINSYIEGRRSGLPDDVVCVRYHFETPEWEMEARASWWQGRLYRGRGVHFEIVGYIAPDNEKDLSRDQLAGRVNDWLCGCSVL